MRDRQLDQIDRRILRELLADARLTGVELADRVGLSPSPCSQRLRRLEDEGYISGYVALLDQEKLGLGETVIVEVTLDHHDEDALARFGDQLRALPEILEAFLVTGEYDYFLKVAVAGAADFEAFLREKLYKIPGIRHSRSRFTLRCLKRQLSVIPDA